MSSYQDAVNKRAAQKASQVEDAGSFTDWVSNGKGFLTRGMNVALDRVNNTLEGIAPSDPEQRIQKEVATKVERDELIEKFSTAGRAFGGKIATIGGTTGVAAWSFLKGATGAVSPEAKARLDKLDTFSDPVASSSPDDSQEESVA
jgi:hypothetical protein